MLGLVAFVMLSPQAQEAVFGEFGGVDEFLQSQLAPYHIYPTKQATPSRRRTSTPRNSGVDRAPRTF